MTVRVITLEIYRFCGGDLGANKRWQYLSDRIKQASNRSWQLWEQWHLEHDTPNKQRQYLDDLAAWREADKKTRACKPDRPCLPIPGELDRKIDNLLRREFPELHARTLTLLWNKIRKTIKSRKAARGSLPGWVSILLCHEAKPSFTEPASIPFDSQKTNPQSVLIAPEDSGDNWKLRLRLDRDPDTGRSVAVDCELMTRRRKTRSMVRTLEKIRDGMAKFRGSALVFRRGKWFAQICFELEKQPKAVLDKEKVAVLAPGRTYPWFFWVGGRVFYRGGVGRHVIAVRRRLSHERRERQEKYRYATSTEKGRGRKRATAAWRKLGARWKEFQKRCNHQVTTAIVRECLNRGVGSLEYWQPTGRQRDSRFLSAAGQSDWIRHKTGWDYFQVKTMLEYKCQQAGIVFSIRQFGAKDNEG